VRALQMPTGTGKTITLLSLVTAYQLAHPELGKLIYCTRTVPEMEKCLIELRELVEYRAKYVKDSDKQIMALGLSSKKNLCIHKSVAGARKDAACVCTLQLQTQLRARLAARSAAVLQTSAQLHSAQHCSTRHAFDVQVHMTRKHTKRSTPQACR
jgi:DNA excision repair protein ERCC-2